MPHENKISGRTSKNEQVFWRKYYFKEVRFNPDAEFDETST